MKDNQEVISVAAPSDEERAWVKVLSTGKSNEQTAKQFKINKNTFAYKMRILRERFNCENTSGLVAYFLRNNLID